MENLFKDPRQCTNLDTMTIFLLHLFKTVVQQNSLCQLSQTRRL